MPMVLAVSFLVIFRQGMIVCVMKFMEGLGVENKFVLSFLFLVYEENYSLCFKIDDSILY